MNVLFPGRNLVLIGMMGSGKTTVGRIVSDRLGRSFVDTDAMVEAAVGKPIRAIFADSGERAFRDLEAEAVRRVSALRGQVVAVGGGAVADRRNATHLRATGDLVWLDAAPEVLAERVRAQAPDRPLLAGADPDEIVERLDALARRREESYDAAGSLTVDTTGRTPEDIADEVLEWARRQPGLLAREELDTW